MIDLFIDYVIPGLILLAVSVIGGLTTLANCFDKQVFRDNEQQRRGSAEPRGRVDARGDYTEGTTNEEGSTDADDRAGRLELALPQLQQNKHRGPFPVRHVRNGEGTT